MASITRFATDGIAATDRLRYWNSVADEVYTGTFVNADSQRLFEGHMLSWRVGDLDMIRTRSVNATVGRRPLDMSEERIIMHMQLRGRCQHRQMGREALLEPGDFVVGSPHSPYHVDLTAHEMVVVEFPKDQLAERVPHLDDVLARRLSGATASAHVFNDFLLSLWRQAEGSAFDDAEWTAGINRVFYDLAAMAIRDALRDGPAGPADRSLRRQALAVIDTSLSDPDLRTASIANRLGTSVRTVQNLFASAGTTPSAAIVDRRLERAADRLMSQPGATITDVAFALGFNDSAYFTRRFRQKFGVSPSAWRLGHRPS
jgi:AraC-like DNA-binding protein